MAQTLHDQVLTDSLIVEYFRKNIPDVIDICPSFEDTAEQSIFAVNRRFIQDVTIESLVCVERRHTLNLYPRSSEQYRPQAACL